MNDNYRTRIFLKADNYAKQKHGKFYTELNTRLQEAIWRVAKREVDTEIRREIEGVK